MNKALKFASIGFLFGVVGLYVFAMLSLLSPFLEAAAAPFFYPAQKFALLIAGTSGSTADVITLTLFNGALYGMLFVLIRVITKKTTGA